MTAVAAPTLVGSILSTIGTRSMLATYIFLPPKLEYIRHILIRNLAVAGRHPKFVIHRVYVLMSLLEFGLHLGNAVSGLTIVVQREDLEDGPAYVASGFLTQLYVQAVDCNMLVISVALFYILKKRSTLSSLSITAALICAPWILPLITSFTALGLHYYHPISGNWCWIQAEPKYLRDVLTHGWRFVIIT